MKSILPSLFFYLVAFPIIIIAHGHDPTNLAGPGVDVLAYVLAILISIFLLVKNGVIFSTTSNFLTSSLFIHIIGFISLIILPLIN